MLVPVESEAGPPIGVLGRAADESSFQCSYKVVIAGRNEGCPCRRRLNTAAHIDESDEMLIEAGSAAEQPAGDFDDIDGPRGEQFLQADHVTLGSKHRAEPVQRGFTRTGLRRTAGGEQFEQIVRDGAATQAGKHGSEVLGFSLPPRCCPTKLLMLMNRQC